MGANGAKEDPRMIGYLEPMYLLNPNTWIRIAIPLVKRLADTRNAVVLASSPMAPLRIRGTAIVPGHMASTCWKPTSRFLPGLIFSENVSISGPPVSPNNLHELWLHLLPLP